MTPLPTHARVVVIGGGISGCSVAYHLARLGWRDVVLLERKQLTSGTTWHAAGLVGQLRATRNMTRLAKYSADLYIRLEAETGIATGMRQNGSITLALTPERREELLRQATLARAFDIEVDEISPAEAKAAYPHLDIAGVVGAVRLPRDGQCDPANIAMALAKGARQRGARIAENVKVTGVTAAAGRVTGEPSLLSPSSTGGIPLRGSSPLSFGAPGGVPARAPGIGMLGVGAPGVGTSRIGGLSVATVGGPAPDAPAPDGPTRDGPVADGIAPEGIGPEAIPPSGAALPGSVLISAPAVECL